MLLHNKLQNSYATPTNTTESLRQWIDFRRVMSAGDYYEKIMVLLFVFIVLTTAQLFQKRSECQKNITVYVY